jgi:hypothetical protein
MSQGFQVDQTHGGTAVPTWVEGAPQRSVWTGVKLTDKPRIEIETWRCGRCGFLEQYASGGPSQHEASRRQMQRVALVAAIAIGVGAMAAGVVIALVAG